MARLLVLGLLPDATGAEAAINHLLEAGVSERSISLIAVDGATARAIIDDGGPLHGTDADAVAARLEALGVDSVRTARLDAGLRAGGYVVALAAADAQDVAETLKDAGADPVLSRPLPR